MASSMHECRRIDHSFFQTAPACYRATVEVRASSEEIFDSFENAEDWPIWAAPITKVEWTSPKPFGVGTTRTVTMVGNMVGEEEFIAWERGSHMAFCFTRASSAMIEAFGEDYQVVDLGNGACSVTWTMAIETGGIGRFTTPLSAPFMRFGLSWMLGRFKRHVEGRHVAAAA